MTTDRAGFAARRVAEPFLVAWWRRRGDEDYDIVYGASRPTWGETDEWSPLYAHPSTQAAALLTKEREARVAAEEEVARADYATRRAVARAESAEAEAKRLREALAEFERATVAERVAAIAEGRT
ncbi:MAG TPA: hypothetical protein VJQ42_02130 [Rhodanobacteraceae bacterium]|nr:hypothetical protein [Rhodanobacteraceae bacterium]